MRIRIALTLDFDRAGPDEPEQHEHRDNDTLVENAGHPRMVGFTRETEGDE